MHNLIWLETDLQMFAGDGGAPAAEGAAAPAQADTQPQAEKLLGSSRRANTGGLENVVYGKADTSAEDGQGSAAGSEEPAEEPAQQQDTPPAKTPKEKKAEFRALIEGEYKEEFNREFQSKFDRRHKPFKDDRARLESIQPLLDVLSARYGIEDGNVEKLVSAVKGDEAYASSAAEAAGVSVEQYNADQRMREEVVRLRRQLSEATALREASQQQEQARRQLETWMEQAQGMREAYPDFDLNAECRDNPQFVSMLKAGVPVQHAYEVLHLEDIKTGVARQTAQAAEKRAAEAARSRAQRPVENGTSSQSGVVHKTSVNDLTKADMEEIIRRVSRGEKISF